MWFRSFKSTSSLKSNIGQENKQITVEPSEHLLENTRRQRFSLYSDFTKWSETKNATDRLARYFNCPELTIQFQVNTLSLT